MTFRPSGFHETPQRNHVLLPYLSYSVFKEPTFVERAVSFANPIVDVKRNSPHFPEQISSDFDERATTLLLRLILKDREELLPARPAENTVRVAACQLLFRASVAISRNCLRAEDIPSFITLCKTSPIFQGCFSYYFFRPTDRIAFPRADPL
jgi:hypothetical protein